jgi:quercetin dioxygenase-like cupin family protein
MVIDTHTHEVEVWAIVRSGNVALTVDGHTRELAAGDTFTLEARKPHAERYGSQGSVFRVARRHAVPGGIGY